MRLPELSSDLDDSDNLLPGSGNGGGFSSIRRLCGALDDLGRLGSGSSMLMDFFPFTVAPGINDFLLSFLVKPGVGSDEGAVRSSSPERRRRENILDCFLGTVLKSTAGAVVMISGAVASLSAAAPTDWEEDRRLRSNVRRGTGGAASSA